MWIESTRLSTVRRCIVSPPGYQSPTLGDSVPVPGSQEAQRVTLQPRVTTSKLSRVPQLFASTISTSRTRREANNGNRISQLITSTQKEINLSTIHIFVRKKKAFMSLSWATFLTIFYTPLYSISAISKSCNTPWVGSIEDNIVPNIVSWTCFYFEWGIFNLLLCNCEG